MRSNVPNSQISPYRFNVETYTIGGPVFIPKVFNREKKKLFFFWSQEYTGQFVSGGTQNKYTPTALERNGDFSQSRQNNGSLITITDPTTGAPFPGNMIPANRIDPTGQAMLNFFPLPNFVGTGTQANVVNYFEAASATHPRRNDVLRVDTYLTSKLSGYFRYINDHDDMIALYQGVQFSKGTGGTLGDKGISPIDHPNPGHGYSGTVTYSISPTLINEFTVGKSWNTWSYYSLDNYASAGPLADQQSGHSVPAADHQSAGRLGDQRLSEPDAAVPVRRAAQQLDELHAELHFGRSVRELQHHLELSRTTSARLWASTPSRPASTWKTT